MYHLGDRAELASPPTLHECGRSNEISENISRRRQSCRSGSAGSDIVTGSCGGGEWIEKSTRQGNANTARQMEAAHKTALAKGELGIIERPPAPTLKKSAEDSFLPYVASTFSKQPKTKEYYEYGVKCLLGFEKIAAVRLDAITSETIGAYVASRQEMKKRSPR